MRQLKSRQGIIALILGLLSAILLYTSFFQRNFFSKTYLAITLGIFLCATLGIFLANQHLLGPFLKSFKQNNRRWMVLAAFVLASLLTANASLQPLYTLLPEHSIRIHIPAQDNQDIQSINLESVENALGYIPYTSLELEGNWKIYDEVLQIQTDADFTLEWHGESGNFLEVVFQPIDSPTSAEVWIDGQQSLLDLQENNSPFDIAFHQDSPISFFSMLPACSAFLVLACYIILLAWGLLARLHLKKSRQIANAKGWFFYALPLVVIWGFSLLVFWPGMMSTDSINQWEQAITGEMTNWHPIFHTFIISTLIKLWYSPAIVAIVQILALSLVFAWGMGILQKYGAPKGILWAVTILFACFPPNTILSITLWKDVAYAISSLAFFLCILQICLSSGKWLGEGRNWLVLGIAGFFAAVFRHNGAAVAFATLVVLIFIFKDQRKKIIWSLAAAILIWLGAGSALDWAYQPASGPSTQANQILLPHIAAHIEAGTELDGEQSAYLNGLMPLEEWNYNCCYSIGSIYYHRNFDRDTFLVNLPANLEIALAQFKQNPLINVRHQLCASDIIWKFTSNRCSFKSLHAFNLFSSGEESWIENNDLGLEEHSFFPKLVSKYTNYLAGMGFFTGESTPLLKPAFHLYLSLFLIGAASIRQRNAKILALLLPVILQSLILAIIIFAPSFRYQYGICLISLFCLGLPFLPKQD